MWQVRPCAIGLLTLLASACSGYQASTFYSDVRLEQKFPNELIKTSPFVVLARVRSSKSNGPLGITKGQNGVAFPVQPYECILQISRSFRGELEPGSLVSMKGYQSEGKVMIGAPRGLCGPVNDLGIYFLERENDSGYRVRTDIFRTWIAIGGQPLIAEKTVVSDVPLAIFETMIAAVEGQATISPKEGLSNIVNSIQSSIGRARFGALLQSRIMDSANINFKVEACEYLNEIGWGIGFTRCLLDLQKRADLTEKQRIILKEAINKASEGDEKLLAALRKADQKALAFWAGTEESRGIHEFVCLIAAHPNSKLSVLGKEIVEREFGASEQCP